MGRTSTLPGTSRQTMVYYHLCIIHLSCFFGVLRREGGTRSCRLWCLARALFGPGAWPRDAASVVEGFSSRGPWAPCLFEPATPRGPAGDSA